MRRCSGSVGPSIREAIKVFNYLGVFESQTRKGTVLCEHSRISKESLTWSFFSERRDICDLMDLRKALEQECWFQLCAAQSKDPGSIKAVLERLTFFIGEMDKAFQSDNETALVEADFNFHLVVIESSANAQFAALFQTLQAFTYEEIRASNVFRKKSKRIVQEHEEFVEALLANDLVRLFELFRIHIENAKDRVLKVKLERIDKRL